MSVQDRILHAWFAGTARHLATNTEVSQADAIAQLRELAAGRTDLLAEVAGIALGVSEGRMDAYLGRRIADLCIAAGADQGQLADWIAEGRSRAARARQYPTPTPAVQGGKPHANGAGLYRHGYPLDEAQFTDAWAAYQAERAQMPSNDVPAREIHNRLPFLTGQYPESFPSIGGSTTPGGGTRAAAPDPRTAGNPHFGDTAGPSCLNRLTRRCPHRRRGIRRVARHP